MPLERIENTVTVVATANSKETAKKQSLSQTSQIFKDTVSIGHREDDIGRVHWAPFFPIGDTQAIFKMEK